MSDTPQTGPDTKSETRDEKRRRLRSGARFNAIQALFQMEAEGATADRLQHDFLNWRQSRDPASQDEIAPEADEDLFDAILDHVVTWQARIDQMTDRALVEKWPIARIDPVLRALFRAAGAELVGQPDTPPKVIITEYLRLAQVFYDEGPEGKLVNAVLDHMARAARPAAF